MKRLLMPVLYCVVVAGVVLGLSQVIEQPAAAEGAGCCLTSADCPGKQLCYAPSSGRLHVAVDLNAWAQTTARIRGRTDAAQRLKRPKNNVRSSESSSLPYRVR
jgi:hypothetical protein